MPLDDTVSWQLHPKQEYHLVEGCGGELDEILEDSKVVAKVCRRCGKRILVAELVAEIKYTSTWVKVKPQEFVDPETFEEARKQLEARIRDLFREQP
jgi:DNA-directed RNA polymerase subunit RPC12/RpoP